MNDPDIHLMHLAQHLAEQEQRTLRADAIAERIEQLCSLAEGGDDESWLDCDPGIDFGHRVSRILASGRPSDEQWADIHDCWLKMIRDWAKAVAEDESDAYRRERGRHSENDGDFEGWE